MSHLVYAKGHPYADQFPNVRYPARHEVPTAQAELMRQAMPNPEAFEIVEVEPA